MDIGEVFEQSFSLLDSISNSENAETHQGLIKQHVSRLEKQRMTGLSIFKSGITLSGHER